MILPRKGRLTDDELVEATYYGHRRQEISSRSHTDTHNLQGRRDPAATHIEGCKSEKFVSKMLGIPWVPIVEDHALLNGGDVGPHGVRGTTRPNGSLILHPTDADWRAYFLVINEEPVFTLAGWMRGENGKLPRYWRTDVPSPAFFVPQSMLRLDLPEGETLAWSE